MLTSPLEGYTVARSSNMTFRNDEQLELLAEILKKESGGKVNFRTVVFECPVEASLSWRLPPDEARLIDNSFNFSSREGPDSEPKFTEELEDDAGLRKKLKELGMYSSTAVQGLSKEEIKDVYKNTRSNWDRLELLKEWWDQ